MTAALLVTEHTKSNKEFVVVAIVQVLDEVAEERYFRKYLNDLRSGDDLGEGSCQIFENRAQ
jgi:hypothetical protein